MAEKAERTQWIALANGALDIRDHELGTAGGEIIATPAVPGLPRFLHGVGARLWRRMVDAPLEDEILSGEEREILEEMASLGLASTDSAHIARVVRLPKPWLESPLHELVYALIARVAVQLDVECLFVKGPTLFAQGLRTRSHSGDVDCWVRPGAERDLAEAMKAWGWVPAYSAFTGTPVLHSLTLRAGSWGCAIDVHSWFPGMVVPPAVAFDYVRDRSSPRGFAGVEVLTPDRRMHAVISALHESRPLSGSLPSAAQLDHATRTLDLFGAEDILPIVQELHAGYALRTPIERAFPGSQVDLGAQEVPPDWRWRLSRGKVQTYVNALRALPISAWPRTLYRLAWPASRDIGDHDGSASVWSISFVRFRVRRLSSFVLGRPR